METVSPSLVVFGCVRSLSIVDDYHVKRFRKFFSAEWHSAGINIVWILLQNVSKCYNGDGKNNNVLIIRFYLIKFTFVFTVTFLTFRMIDALDPDGPLWRKYWLNSWFFDTILTKKYTIIVRARKGLPFSNKFWTSSMTLFLMNGIWSRWCSGRLKRVYITFPL